MCNEDLEGKVPQKHVITKAMTGSLRPLKRNASSLQDESKRLQKANEEVMVDTVQKRPW